MLKTYQRIILGIGGLGIITSALAGEIDTEIDWKNKLNEDREKKIFWMYIPENSSDLSSVNTLSLNKDNKGSYFIRYHFTDKDGIIYDIFDSDTNGLIGLVKTGSDGKPDQSVDAILKTRMMLDAEDCIMKKVSKDENPKLYEEAYQRILEIYSKLGDKSTKILTDEDFSIKLK